MRGIPGLPDAVVTVVLVVPASVGPVEPLAEVAGALDGAGELDGAAELDVGGGGDDVVGGVDCPPGVFASGSPY